MQIQFFYTQRIRDVNISLFEQYNVENMMDSRSLTKFFSVEERYASSFELYFSLEFDEFLLYCEYKCRTFIVDYFHSYNS